MIGDNIKRLRKKNKLTLSALANKTQVSVGYLSDIEKGKKTNPSLDFLTKIADALGVPLDYLTRKSAKAVIEDRLTELNITFDELCAKTNIPMEFFDNLDYIIPEEGDYNRMQKISYVLNIDPSILVDALYRQEPPLTEEKFKEWDKNSNLLSEESALYENGEFKSPEAAIQFILKQPAIMGFGGFDVNKMSDEEIIEFANELLNQLKLLSYKYKK